MTHENLADLTARLKATRLVQHMGRDYLAPLRAAQTVLGSQLPYEKALLARGAGDPLDLSKLSPEELKQAEIDARALIKQAAAAFRNASIEIGARITDETPLPSPGEKDIEFGAAYVGKLIDQFLVATADCLDSHQTDLTTQLKLVTAACMSSREAQGAVLFGLPEAASNKAVVGKIYQFQAQLAALQRFTTELAGKFPVDSEESKLLVKYAESEKRRLALLDSFIHSNFMLNYRTLHIIYDAADDRGSATGLPGRK